ncbi:MAG: transglycosylase SLT domain-containing protein [Desulfonatronovibrionaceae bacterium]
MKTIPAITRGRGLKSCSRSGPGAGAGNPWPCFPVLSPMNMVIPWVLLFFWMGCFFPQAEASSRIYYYQDENGTFHFTDLPTSKKYQPFLPFRSEKPDSRDIRSLARNYGRLHGIDPHLIRAMIEVESGADPMAVSPAGAEGLMQIMPVTQQELGLEAPFEPESNIEAGTRYLKHLMNRFESLPLALAAYNAGPSAVDRHRGIPPYAETRNYVRKVLKIYAQFTENTR